MVHYAKIRPCDVDADRFWSLVDRRGSDDCWLWQGTRDKDVISGQTWSHVTGVNRA